MPGSSRLRSVSLGLFCLVLLFVAVGSSTAWGASTPYVVLLKNGVSASEEASRVGATPSMLYGAPIDGYAAVLSETALQQVKADPNVLMSVPDRRFSARSE